MNLLLIEDETDFVDLVRSTVEQPGSSHKLLSAEDVGLLDQLETEISYEEQFLARLSRIQEQYEIDLVLLDTDLSRFRTIPISQTLCRQALQELGLPACRYKKSYSQTQSNRLRDLKRVAREGASAVWVPPELVKGHDMAPLVVWLEHVDRGFKQIHQRLQDDPGLLTKPLGPAGILARVLGKASLRADLLGYTAQNLFFFAAPATEDDGDEKPPSPKVLATRLGYWLINYILTFPGPILKTPAAAALLNLSVASFEEEAVQALVRSAKYSGPFDGIDKFYWRAQLSSLLEEGGGDIAAFPQLEGQALVRVDAALPGAPSYFCVLSGEPVARAEAANPNPDWIPPGAELTRIRQELLDDLDPMLNI